jgi:putative tricarboxylic transport membrane protein
MHGKKVSVAILSLLLFVFFAACSTENGATEETSAASNGDSTVSLDGDIEFVVPASAGGGSDINARMVSQIMSENNIVDENIMVVNKPGGSTAVGNSYTYNQEGSNNVIMTWNSSQIISPLINDNDVTIEDLTPLGTLVLDSYLFVVGGDSEYETFDEIVEASRENPDSITIGGTGQGTELHILSHLINKYGDANFQYISFDSGGEALSSLLGGHIDSILSNPGEVQSQIDAGDVRALATSSAERLEGSLEDIPTFDELGYSDIEITSFRGYVGPPGLSEDEIKFWEDVLLQVHESETWQKDYIESNQLHSEYLNAEESRELYEEVLELYTEAAEEMQLTE